MKYLLLVTSLCATVFLSESRLMVATRKVVPPSIKKADWITDEQIGHSRFINYDYTSVKKPVTVDEKEQLQMDPAPVAPMNPVMVMEQFGTIPTTITPTTAKPTTTPATTTTAKATTTTPKPTTTTVATTEAKTRTPQPTTTTPKPTTTKKDVGTTPTSAAQKTEPTTFDPKANPNPDPEPPVSPPDVIIPKEGTEPMPELITIDGGHGTVPCNGAKTTPATTTTKGTTRNQPAVTSTTPKEEAQKSNCETIV